MRSKDRDDDLFIGDRIHLVPSQGWHSPTGAAECRAQSKTRPKARHYSFEDDGPEG